MFEQPFGSSNPSIAMLADTLLAGRHGHQFSQPVTADVIEPISAAHADGPRSRGHVNRGGFLNFVE